MSSETDIVLRLQEELRGELKAPLGPIYTDTAELLADAGRPLITVGDVVTYHVIESGETPALAITDEQTERSAVSAEIAETIDAFDGFEQVRQVSNPAATLTAELLSAIRTAIDSDRPTRIAVDGEEDLAALPVVLAAPQDSAVVYGQPGEGMVLATVDSDTQSRCRAILSQMDGSTEQCWSLLGTER